MPFEPDGRLQPGSRPQRPLAMPPPSHVLNHMIPRVALISFWNELLTNAQHDPITQLQPMVRYMEIVGFVNAGPVATEILANGVQNLSLDDQMILEQVLIWQCYNLFEGPGSDFRPGHSPPPERVMQHFAALGATTYDYPITIQPHCARAQILWGAFGHMEDFNAPGPAPDDCLDLLEQVAEYEWIPAEDVNWFALNQPHFWGMTPIQRRQFFQECMHIRGWRTTAAEAEREYERLQAAW